MSMRERRVDVPLRIVTELPQIDDKMDKVTCTSEMRLLSLEIRSSF